MNTKSFVEQLHFSRKINIFTDVEPDDMLMLHILFKWLIINDPTHKYTINIICSVTTTPEKKCQFLEDFIKEEYPTLISSVTLYKGYPTKKRFEYTSNRKFPLWFIILLSIAVFAAIIFTSNIYVAIVAVSMFAYVMCRDYMIKDYPIYWLDSINFSQSVIICSAPIDDLMMVYKQNNHIFRDTIMAIYGSFNVRGYIKKTEENALVAEFLNSFAKTLYFESYYAIGPCNKVQQITNNNMSSEIEKVFAQKPEVVNMMNKIFQKLSTHKYIYQTMLEWNKHILATLQAKTTKSDIDSRIITSITTSDFKQFVAADWVMMLILLSDIQNGYKQEDLTFQPTIPYYPVINQTSDTSNVYRFEITSPDYQFFMEILDMLHEAL